jgi:hypothetical protein
LGGNDFGPALAARRNDDVSLKAPRHRALGVAVFWVLAGASLAACRRSASHGSPPTLVQDRSHDFGRVTQGDTLRHAFMTHNRTDASITVENPRTVLGCTGAATPRALAPNQIGKLEVTCHANVPGPLRVSLPLRANARPAGELTVAAEVEPLLVFDRALIEMNVPFGQAHETSARLGGKLARSARLTLASAAPSGMDVQVLPSADGGTEGAVLRLERPAVGVHAGTLRFHTALAEPAAIELPYSVKVTGTLTISPTNPVLDLAAPGGTRSVITVTSTQPGFRVERAEVLEGPFAVYVRNEPEGAAVEVSIVPTKLREGSRGVNGRIRIASNDRTEPNKEVSLFALGQPPRAARDR